LIPELLGRALVAASGATLRLFRLPGLSGAGFYALLGRGRWQPMLDYLGRLRALDVHRRAVRRCPGYAAFLKAQGAVPARRLRDWTKVPCTDKLTYVKKYSLEERCFEGRIPSRGVVVDESSGSSGTPNNWVRGTEERASVRRLLQHAFALTFRGEQVFLLNCFALGPWATGMNVTMSLAEAAIVKSIGPDKQKLENTLRTFGPRYRYVVAGYPPFIKDWLDTTALDLAPYRMHLVVGGEGISEALRDRFMKSFADVHSSYGASDLEINIAAETDLTIALRKLCVADHGLCKALFGRDDAPMIFQYNALDYLIEVSDAGELVITIARASNIAPKVRYNIRDLGGAMPTRALRGRLEERGVKAELPRGLEFPILWVYGRSDLTVPFYGAKVFTTDLDGLLNSEEPLRRCYASFQMRTGHDANLSETLTITLERLRSPGPELDDGALRRVLYEGLTRVNQDFREVSKMFGPDRIIIERFDHGQGPFAARDIRVKNQYLGSAGPPQST
jgi:phenylacetate-CoA ligase